MFSKFRYSGHGESARAGWMLVLSLLLAMFSTGLWAGVTATLDRSTIAEGDTVTLTIEADGKHSQGAQPDLSPLRRDFNILGTSTSQQMQIINGRMSSSARLRVELEPKRGGSIEIPALKVGGETTAPLTLTVADQPAATASQPGSPLYLETEVEPHDAATFVQQQIQYTTRLYYSMPLVEGSLGDPEPEHAVVERLGEDKHYQTTVNGQRYQVIERNYAIFPEQSGTFTIPPVSFTGRVATGGAARRPFGRMDSMIEQFFGRDTFGNDSFFATPFGDPGKRVHTRGEAVTVKVKPHPVSYSAATWLPGEDLVLHDSWAAQPPEFRVGEPVTRVISIDAKGLAASHLPEVAMPAIAGMRIYPEQPVRESRTDGAVVYGHSEQSFAFVPQQAGKLTLPEIRLSWWDIKAGKERVAVLPSWNVEV
ncbi:MAG: BatD family protein, partial [Gammaproteobacteria bacterium]